MIDIMDVKLRVIKAACGIVALSVPDLLRRLEELYLEGLAEGFKIAMSKSERPAPQHTEQHQP